MFYKIRTHYRHHEGKIFAWMSLFLAAATCVALPILPNFVKSILGDDSSVSIFYSFLAIVTLISSMTSGLIFKKFERTTVIKIGLGMLAITTFSLIFATRLVSMAVLLVLKTWLEMILLITLSLLVRDFAKSRSLGQEEGLKFRFQSTGALIGLLLGGFLASRVDYELVFASQSMIALVGLAYFYQKHVVEKSSAIINVKHTEKLHLLKNIKEFFSSPDRAKIYVVATIQMIWISSKYLYIPLYVAGSNYLPGMAGLILAIAIIPVIVFETRTGEFGDRYGIKNIITIGFLIIGTLLTVIFISPWPLLNFGLLAVANVGSAFIEPMRETYFLKHTSKEREGDLFGIYMTSEQFGNFVMPLIGVATLAFLPFKFIFLVFGGLMFLAAVFTRLSLKRS